jgi:hypothetical protein
MAKYSEFFPPLNADTLARGISTQLNFSLTPSQLLDDLALLISYSQFKKKLSL